MLELVWFAPGLGPEPREASARPRILHVLRCPGTGVPRGQEDRRGGRSEDLRIPPSRSLAGPPASPWLTVSLLLCLRYRLYFLLSVPK